MGVGYRLPDGGSSTALDWDGGCDAGTVPNWDAAPREKVTKVASFRLVSQITRLKTKRLSKFTRAFTRDSTS